MRTGIILTDLCLAPVPSSQVHGQSCNTWVKSTYLPFPLSLPSPRKLHAYDVSVSMCRGYVASCRDIVGAAKLIESRIKSEIPELYILGKPPASVVAFGSRRPNVSVLEVGDKMAKKGWHLNAIQGPSAVHIACTVCPTSIDDSVRYRSLSKFEIQRLNTPTFSVLCSD